MPKSFLFCFNMFCFALLCYVLFIFPSVRKCVCRICFAATINLLLLLFACRTYTLYIHNTHKYHTLICTFWWWFKDLILLTLDFCSLFIFYFLLFFLGFSFGFMCFFFFSPFSCSICLLRNVVYDFECIKWQVQLFQHIIYQIK